MATGTEKICPRRCAAEISIVNWCCSPTKPRTIFEAQEHGVGLQLSGHTHGGQLWPWTYLVRLQQPVVAGLARFGNSLVYVSRGTGYWGPPMRLGAPSEIAELTLALGLSRSGEFIRQGRGDAHAVERRADDAARVAAALAPRDTSRRSPAKPSCARRAARAPGELVRDSTPIKTASALTYPGIERAKRESAARKRRDRSTPTLSNTAPTSLASRPGM